MSELLTAIVNLVRDILAKFGKRSVEPDETSELLEEELDKYHKLPKEDEHDKTTYWKED